MEVSVATTYLPTRWSIKLLAWRLVAYSTLGRH
jgi:hypothetical protein